MKKDNNTCSFIEFNLGNPLLSENQKIKIFSLVNSN